MIELKREHRLILVAILRRERKVRDTVPDRFDLDCIIEQRRDGPRWRPGEMFPEVAGDPSGQKRFLRALLALDAAGLVCLFRSGGKKITNVRLSDAGRKLLAEVAAAAHPSG